MADTPPIISVHNLQKVYLERAILEDVSFTVHEGERVALMGANGAGKSTLLGIMAGRVTPEAGEVRLRRGADMGELDQEGGLRPEWSVREALDSAFTHLRALEGELDGVHHRLAESPPEPESERLLKRQSWLMEQLEHHEHHTVESRMEEARRELGVPGNERKVGELSGGERRRLALCRTLLTGADLLLLDEPTNHLDAETLDWLEAFLARFRGTVVFVTHDRYFLDNVATKMIEVRRGRANVYMGNYSDYLDAKQAEEEQAAREESTRRILLRREMDWLRRQPKARTTKSKARIDRVHNLIDSKPLAPDSSMEFLIPSGPRLGKELVEAENLSYEIGGRELIRDFNFRLGAGDRVGVVGRNGLGKTTLLRLLMKQLEPDGGHVKHGASVKFVYADQSRENLDPDKTVLEEVAGDLEYVEVGGRQIPFRTWLGRFLFDDNTSAMPIRLLSGGEKNRVQMAKMLREGGNIVVLDEPTNDLDLPTLRVLEEGLARFEGCAFVVSHDRYFLNRVVNRVIGFRDSGEIVVVEGNYDHYRLYLDKVEGEEEPRAAAEPKAAPEPRTSPRAGQKKLSYHEQREFEGLEERIMEAEELAAELEKKSQDPSTFVDASSEEAKRIVRELEEAQGEVERLYERWAELSERAR